MKASSQSYAFVLLIEDVFHQDDIKAHLTASGVDWEESADLMEVASKCDVIYQTRIQRERFGDRIDLYNKARGKYIVNSKVMNVLPKHGVILHPLPRLDEVSSKSILLHCGHYLHFLINYGMVYRLLCFGLLVTVRNKITVDHVVFCFWTDNFGS